MGISTQQNDNLLLSSRLGIPLRAKLIRMDQFFTLDRTLGDVTDPDSYRD